MFDPNLSLNSLLLLLLNLQQKGAIDVWKDTSEGNSCTDKGIELFITANGELEVSRGDTLDLEILGRILYMNVSLARIRQQFGKNLLLRAQELRQSSIRGPQ